MAIVQFKYGSGALPSTKNSGALYLNQYNKKIYVDLDESNRICVGDFQRVNWTSSSTVTSPGNALKNLTVKDNNILYLTYDSTTGHSALWYYDDSNSPAQFREIISSESISIIASEFDRIDGELTDLDSELENLTGVVDTKVSKEELESYNFATEEEAAAFAIAAISNVQGDAASDTAGILTIQGTRKYVDSKVQEVNSSIGTLDTKVNGIGGRVGTLESTVSEHTTQISSVSQTASGAAETAADALTAAQGAAEVAAEAERLATAAGTAAQAASNLAKEKVTLAEVRAEGYITTAQSNTAITNASNALIGTSTDTANENTIQGAKKHADSLNSSMNSKVDTVAGDVEKNAKAIEALEGQINGLSGSGFATTGYVDQKATATLSSAQGTNNDSKDTITIYGARKYADAINTALDSRITTNNNRLGELDLLVDSVEKSVKNVKSIAETAQEAANQANSDLVTVKATLTSVGQTASGAASLAATANATAESKTTLQAVKTYISDGGYTTTSAVNTAIENAVKSTKEYSDAEDQKITSRIDTLESNIGNLSNIMNFVGILTIDLNHGDTTNPITVDGKSYTAVKGDVVVDNAGEEFVFYDNKWQQIGNITSEATAISNLQGRMNTAESNVTNLQGRMTTGEGNITNLQGRMTTAESNLTTVNDTIGTKLTHSTDTLWGILTWGTW